MHRVFFSLIVLFIIYVVWKRSFSDDPENYVNKLHEMNYTLYPEGFKQKNYIDMTFYT